MIAIGTAGWSIPSRFAQDFADGPSHLERYARTFGAVEINSSFHRPHRRTTYERWAASVPAGFRFAVKIPKAISHEARLVDSGGPIGSFVDQIGGLGDTLGVVLLQLPPSFAFDSGLVDDFLAMLRAHVGRGVGIACEPRHASWFSDRADSCLITHHVARVVADPVLVAGGERPGGWAGLRYHRLHGTPRVYYSAYEEERLSALATLVAHGADAETWCIFDNTASGAATGDALTLRQLLDMRS